MESQHVTDSEAMPAFERAIAERHRSFGALRRARPESGFADETRLWAFDVEAVG
jgi:hypothetical protein